ncbi:MULTISPECIES: hypothetical protein [unclassified Wolbachia]|uniref:hypothetical protein n=1 Tax=unclassified Wolbachia TaxID=2640676 RepID=UPI0022309723|nr:hypothetical protein [Wolbachia endosymbiont (group A) of Apoderus coryli]
MQVLESSKLIYAYKRLLFCKVKVAFGFKLKYNKCKGSYDELYSKTGSQCLGTGMTSDKQSYTC